MPTSLGGMNIAPNVAAAFGKLVPEIFSQEIELTTRELGFTRFKDFVVLKEDLTANPGSTLYVPKIAELRNAQSLSQSKVLAGSGQGISSGFVSLVPEEKGDEVQISQYAGLASPSDLLDLARELLARQALKAENFIIRDIAFGSSANRYFSGGVANQASVAQDLDSDDIDFVVEELEASEALKWPGESFMAFIHPYAKTDLKMDLQAIASYANIAGGLYQGEVGMYNRVRFIESAYVPQEAYSVNGLTSAGTAGITIAAPTGFTLGKNFCRPETITFTYTASGDSWAVSGSKSGARKCALFANTKTAADIINLMVEPDVAKATTYTDANATTFKVALAVEDEDGNTKGYDVVLNAAAMSGAASDDTATLVIVVNTQTLVFGQRHLCMGVIRNVTPLGVEAFDYGRTVGLAWNAFWDADFLHKSYGWVIEALR